MDRRIVAFADQVGGWLFVSIEHPGGLLTIYSFLASIGVVVEQLVEPGTPLGTAGTVFRLGVRRLGN